MRLMRLVSATIVLLLATPLSDIAGDDNESPLPPEQTRVIYEALLPPEEDASPPPQGQSKENALSNETALQDDRVAQALLRCGIIAGGRPGQWEFLYGGHQFFLLADSRDNRLRLLTPLETLTRLRLMKDFDEKELFEKMLKANYHATGEARFCLNRDVVWLAYFHPLQTFTEQDLLAALDQIVIHAKNILALQSAR